MTFPVSDAAFVDWTGCDELSRRIRDARILREHHIWEAVRLLAPMAPIKAVPDISARFKALMDRDALVDALMLLAGQCDPPIVISGLAHVRHFWVCSAQRSDEAGRRCHANHTDPAAAILLGLLAAAEGEDGR